MGFCSTSSITVEGRGLRELILKVYLIEFCSLWKTCETRHPFGYEEEIGTNYFCLVEFDLFVRIFLQHGTQDSFNPFHSFTPPFIASQLC